MNEDSQTYAILGACFEVHKQLGGGFNEAVYQQALALEFQTRNIPFQKEVKIDVYYKDVKLDAFYRADFICYDSVIVELKAIPLILSEHEAQVLNYMSACHISRGLLVNFGSRRLQHKRFIFSKNLKEILEIEQNNPHH